MVLTLSLFGTVQTGAAPVEEEESLPVIFIADNSVGTGTGTSATNPLQASEYTSSDTTDTGRAKATALYKAWETLMAAGGGTISGYRFAVSDGESVEYLFSVAAPVFASDGALAAAVGTYRIAPGLSAAAKKRMIEAVIQCANSISCALLTAGRK